MNLLSPLFYLLIGITSVSALTVSPLSDSVSVDEILGMFPPALSGLVSNFDTKDNLEQKISKIEFNDAFLSTAEIHTLPDVASDSNAQITLSDDIRVSNAGFSALDVNFGDDSEGGSSWRYDPDAFMPRDIDSGGITPIVINLCSEIPNVFYNWGAFATTSYFDLDNDGFDEPMWVWPNKGCNAILSVDLNQNGIIDNGNEVFNPEGTAFQDAFELFEMHGYDDVYLWFDKPHFDERFGIPIYGTTEPDELQTLKENSISEIDFEQIVRFNMHRYIHEQSPDQIRVYAYCESCVLMNDGSTLSAYDVRFDYNNRIGFLKNQTSITVLKHYQSNYTSTFDGEIIIGNHLDNFIDAGNHTDILIFGNAGSDVIHCGMYENNLCFGGYGDDYLCGSGNKYGGSQMNTIHDECE